uniref:Acetyl-coenzyme A carboxylase carboxyl transferase subunit beta, chloroplastic n=1 Tax=Closterium baillyanum TaxID=1416941 RepID=A0A191T5Q6_9VIRI|nr:beta subunit of acetyl-CoA carboxylase carboxytransferase [Closterium baillyanum]ANI25724.1 beta subunit of acetyl-CoA carboxylase carboxytransferase [Closterium baillyanum]
MLMRVLTMLILGRLVYMSLVDWFEEKRRLKLLTTPKPKYPESDPSEGLWTQCDNCESMLYVRFLKQNQRICEECGYHLEMNSTERIELLIDPGTWEPMDEDMLPCDVLDFFDQQSYKDRIEENQIRTGLTDAVQTGIGELNGTPIALGVMDFQFMGGSMGSVVGEKLTRLIEYATQHQLPLIIVCASGGARMQEGTLSLMQMAKIASVLQIHQIQQKLLYISILTYPTTGGVTASFGMLGDIIIAEPKAYIAFAGKRVIEQTLRQEVPDGFQVAESLLDHGLLDLIVPRAILKGVLGELFELYKSAPCQSTKKNPITC